MDNKTEYSSDRFSKSLKEIMKRVGKTQAAVAKEIGIDRSAMTRYYQGRNLPNADILINLANCLGVSIPTLLGIPEADSQKPTDTTICEMTGLTIAALSNIKQIREADYQSSFNAYNYVLYNEVFYSMTGEYGQELSDDGVTISKMDLLNLLLKSKSLQLLLSILANSIFEKLHSTYEEVKKDLHYPTYSRFYIGEDEREAVQNVRTLRIIMKLSDEIASEVSNDFNFKRSLETALKQYLDDTFTPPLTAEEEEAMFRELEEK